MFIIIFCYLTHIHDDLFKLNCCKILYHNLEGTYIFKKMYMVDRKEKMCGY